MSEKNSSPGMNLPNVSYSSGTADFEYAVEELSGYREDYNHCDMDEFATNSEIEAPLIP